MSLAKNKKYRQNWIIFLGLCVYYFVAFGLIYNGLGIFLKPISDGMGIPFVQVSLTSTVRIIVGMGTTVLAGRLFPKCNMKLLLGGNILLLVAGCICMSAASNLLMLLTGSVIIGFAAGFSLYSIVPIVLNQWFENPSKYISIATALGGAGGIIFCPIITGLLNIMDWRHTYFVVAMIVLCVMLPIAIFVIRYSPESCGREVYPDGNEKKEMPAGGSDLEAGSCLDGRILLICMVVFFALSAILSGMYGHISSAFWAKGYDNIQVGLLSSFYQTGTTVVQLAFGLISIKLGLKKSLNLVLPFIMIAAIGLIITGKGAFAITAVLAFLLGAGRAFGVINPLVTRAIYGQKNFSKIYSNLYAIFLLVTAGTATLFGAVYNMTDSYNLVYLLVTVCTAIALFITNLIFKSEKQRSR